MRKEEKKNRNKAEESLRGIPSVNIVGAGLAGLSAAITLARRGIISNLISAAPSERAQSVLAEGGINAALDTMDEEDSTEDHFRDTMQGGCYLEGETAVRNLTENAPDIVKELSRLGVPFLQKKGVIQLRNFGGQKKKRTAFAKSSTGKVIMTALVDEARKYEAEGLIRRYPNHRLLEIFTGYAEYPEDKLEEQRSDRSDLGTSTEVLTSDDLMDMFARRPIVPATDFSEETRIRTIYLSEEQKRREEEEDGDDREVTKRLRALSGILVEDMHTGEISEFTGPLILCTGGMNGFFEGMTTGTILNTGDAAAIAFQAGVNFGNLEFIQYHPTTVEIPDKRMLISEAARGEGGRLYVERNGKPWYFMEEKYPELGNLMPRDVVSREMDEVVRTSGCGNTVFLDMTGISGEVWEKKLSDLRTEIREYLALDPAVTPVPVKPGIHFFMGGIRVDDRHAASVPGIYAAGEAACKYHGANRLGGNSLLAAIYGGKTAAESLAEDLPGLRSLAVETGQQKGEYRTAMAAAERHGISGLSYPPEEVERLTEASSPEVKKRLGDALLDGLGIVRNAESLQRAVEKVENILRESGLSLIDQRRAMLGLAMLRSALSRKESRGAHFRSDYPKTNEALRKVTIARNASGRIRIK